MDEYMRANQTLWDEWTAIHARSKFYDLAGFKAGRSSLNQVELEEVGEVRERSLLHLQCHFGQDTLSWARLGARVTGVDFSLAAIALARSLSEELGIEARFIQSDLYGLPAVLDEKFDLVFTSYGVLPWLPDLERWGQIIAHFLKPGGVFYIVEGHPFAHVLDFQTGTSLDTAYSYFHSPEPAEYKTDGSYADPTAHVDQPVQYEWQHTLADVVNALLSAGLQLIFLHEFPFSSYQWFPYLVRHDDGHWWPPAGVPKLPLMFSIKALRV